MVIGVQGISAPLSSIHPHTSADLGLTAEGRDSLPVPFLGTYPYYALRYG